MVSVQGHNESTGGLNSSVVAPSFQVDSAPLAHLREHHPHFAHALDVAGLAKIFHGIGHQTLFVPSSWDEQMNVRDHIVGAQLQSKHLHRTIRYLRAISGANILVEGDQKGNITLNRHASVDKEVVIDGTTIFIIGSAL